MTLALLLLPALARAGSGRFLDLDEAQIARELAAIHAATPTLPARVEAVSEGFLGTPYRLGPLGEGPDGDFDRGPLISFRRADCTTFVEETMALSLEPDLARAKALLQRIRYKDGRVSYQTRNHFPETDWIPNNVRAGFLSDLTLKVAGRRARWAFKTIRKREWYLAKSTGDLEGFAQEPLPERLARVKRWRALGESMPQQNARLPYLPVAELAAFAARIPSATIGNVVREPRSDHPVIVTHQVLFFQRPEGLVIRHAAYGKRVQEEPALAYFERMKGAAWPVVGINLNAIVDHGLRR